MGAVWMTDAARRDEGGRSGDGEKTVGTNGLSGEPGSTPRETGGTKKVRTFIRTFFVRAVSAGIMPGIPFRSFSS